MARWQSLPQIGRAAILGAMVGTAVDVRPAQAQPPASNPNEMCGTGETFTVDLPGKALGISDTSGVWRNIDVPAEARPDSVTLPKGCRIYAFLISGFGDNEDYDRIIFYKVAEFVAQNNGYVHVGWWNNLTRPYMERPLHPETITIQKWLPIIGDIGDPVIIHPTPKTTGVPDTFVNTALDLPKANPDEDIQFQSDARLVLKAVRQQNPHALIIVAGHSMGGNAVARMAVEDATVPIDLLALIDPVGNRDSPLGAVGQNNFNWTRWRAANKFRGFKMTDCIRTGVGLNLCKDFDTSFFGTHYRCLPVGNWLTEKPVIGTYAPLACPLAAYPDPGTRLTIGANIKHLYHRWQHETIWPVDFPFTERFNRVSGPNLSSYQEPVLPQLNPLLANDPDRTCVAGKDPNDNSFDCSPIDGHGELIGVRIDGAGDRVRPGLQLSNWPKRSLITFTPGDRRDRLIRLAVDGPAWPYRPQNPDLCLVCDDIITITEQLMLQQPEETEADNVAPQSLATQEPEANASGWTNDDVVVTVGATDDRSGVQEITLTLSGAQAGGTTTPGGSAEATINTEGLTTVSYFARDQAGNQELPPKTLDVRIDKTSPDFAAITDIPINAAGWIGAPVVVSFPASDNAGGSGVAASSPDVALSTEGSGQEVSGTAEDLAGNISTASITLNLDLTPPGIALESRVPAANAADWNNAPVTVTWRCTDALSGVVASSDSVAVGSEGAAQSATGTCRDLADHATTDTLAGINIDTTAPGIALASRTPANTAGWNNSDVIVVWSCTDALSGPGAPSVSDSRSSEGAGQTATGTCVDLASNSASGTESGIKIDKTAPSVTISAPADGAVLLLNAPAASNYACSDSLSGMQSCDGPAASGSPANTSSVGGKQFTVNAIDVAGNTASVTHSYSVQYGFSGFTNPIAPMPMPNVVNAGRTVPVKYFLRDGNGALVTDVATFASLASAPATCDAAAPGVLSEESTVAGSTEMRWDAAAQQFIYNWKTDNAWEGTCRVLQLTLNDGTRHVALFQFR